MREVYLDGASNTPLSRAAYRAMKPFLREKRVGNSMSTHSYGVKAGMAVENARSTMSDLFGVAPEQLFFTSGATESNNWVIWSEAINWRKNHSTGGHIVCSALEHDSVLRSCEEVSRIFDIDVTYLGAEDCIQGVVAKDQVKKACRLDTFLVCVMAVNNELGSENEIEDITNYTERFGIHSLVDCTQALSCGGRAEICLGMRFRNASFMSFSAHKFYGPTGIGGLIAKKDLLPLIVGGAQERGLRGGTSNTAAIVGMSAALEDMAKRDCGELFKDLTVHLCIQLSKKLKGVYFNIPHYGEIPIISLNCSEVVNVYSLADVLDAYGIAVSAGSACDSTHNETAGEFNGSHVLRAIGLSETEIRNTIRISYTRYTTRRDINKLIRALRYVVKHF